MARSDSAGVYFPPPLIFLGFVLLGPLIEHFVHLPRMPHLEPLGIVLVALGFALAAVAHGLFRARGEPVTPWTPSTRIIETGVYARSRNPMYLGMAISALGIALLLESWVAVALVAVALVTVDRLVVAREEAYLESKFGDAYRAYKARVGRWI